MQWPAIEKFDKSRSSSDETPTSWLTLGCYPSTPHLVEWPLENNHSWICLSYIVGNRKIENLALSMKKFFTIIAFFILGWGISYLFVLHLTTNVLSLQHPIFSALQFANALDFSMTTIVVSSQILGFTIRIPLTKFFVQSLSESSSIKSQVAFKEFGSCGFVNNSTLDGYNLMKPW
jgi:hypothetical protein